MSMNFKNMQVVSFESRRAKEMCALIERCGGQAISAPTMREVPLETNTEALAFAERLFADKFQVAIFLTGVGTRMLAQAIETQYPPGRFPAALSSLVTVVRGPKPHAVFREMKVVPTVVVPEPNTWEDLLEALDAYQSVQGCGVAVQEYGLPNHELVAALKDRGAHVTQVPVYRWQLPEDLGPLRQAIAALNAGSVNVVLFTNATQVKHLFDVADLEGCADQLRRAMGQVVIGSVGPIASAALQGYGMTVDYEPDAPYFGPLVRQTARRAYDLLEKKVLAGQEGIDTSNWRRIDMIWAGHHDSKPNRSIDDSVFMKACRREQTPYTPIWLMRQAGRYQRSYREIRRNVTMRDFCQKPDLCAEVTLMAVDRLGVDAAIIFSDLMVVAEPLGLGVEYAPGPIIDQPIRSRDDLKRLKDPDIEDLGHVFDSLDITRKALRPDIALIGFAGAPFTIASYLIEGSGSRHYTHTKQMMHGDPEAWDELMSRLTAMIVMYLNRQIESGADAVQIFDSWVGALSPADYEQYVLPHMKRLIDGVDQSAPLIHFTTGNPALLPHISSGGGDVIGVDWRVDLRDAWELFGDEMAIMGNLDPCVLLTSPGVIRKQVKEILDKVGGRRGHIFNLGHGVLPQTPPQHVSELVDFVHEQSAN